MSRRVFIFAGGGTGGHIYPALAIAEQIREQAGSLAHPLFVCSKRPLDAQILKDAQADFRAIPAEPFGLHPARLAKFAASWPGVVKGCRSLIRELVAAGSQVHVVAMGGFVAAPAAWAASKEQVPLTLVNLDATPGRANRFIASRAQRIFSAAEIHGVLPGCTLVRPIVRKAAIGDGRGGDQRACRRALGVSEQDPVLFVTGASQGATSINRFMAAFVKANAEILRGGKWQIVHQTGKSRGTNQEEDADECRRVYSAAGLANVVQPYFTQMGLCWGAANLAVSRSGAGSVAEAWANATPTMFFPYPYHRDQHQKHNARVLCESGSCLLGEDRIDAEANLSAHGAALLGLLTATERLTSMKLSFNALGPTDGAARIAEHLCA